MNYDRASPLSRKRESSSLIKPPVSFLLPPLGRVNRNPPIITHALGVCVIVDRQMQSAVWPEIKLLLFGIWKIMSLFIIWTMTYVIFQNHFHSEHAESIRYELHIRYSQHSQNDIVDSMTNVWERQCWQITKWSYSTNRRPQLPYGNVYSDRIIRLIPCLESSDWYDT